MAGLTHQRKPSTGTFRNQKKRPQQNVKPPPWAVVKGLFFGRNPLHQPEQHHDQQQQQQQKQKQKEQVMEESGKKCKKMRCSGSLCSNTKVMQKPEAASPEVHKKKASSSSSSLEASSSRSMKAPLHELNGVIVSSTNSSLSLSSASASASSVGGSFRGMPFRRFSGCYECRMVIDPVLGMVKDPSLRTSICTCPECGDIFMKGENLELHQAVRHADRILKVHNTPRTISKFEQYRDSIKSKATKLPKKHPRCIADGNELLRFHCTTFACSLGLNGSSNLCNSIPNCNVCSIIKNGFKVVQELNGKGILTTATSGKAHDKATGVADGNEKRAMLVCRVIAGRVQKSVEGGNMEDYDSVGGDVGVYSNLDELYVFNPKAILPCFVVIYTGF
ncbi:pentatricopeptide repeat-containing protein [Hibiscus syriacus]|uniref:Pentatricopeptide repeat-containing protein n=1 Tax=Hibiscus syriacus TaxID=106335 RepID=A0A6A2WVP5_HIBSY|nr:pentatricopeptide repeat-containing protein [Hibiscus syriacus]